MKIEFDLAELGEDSLFTLAHLLVSEIDTIAEVQAGELDPLGRAMLALSKTRSEQYKAVRSELVKVYGHTMHLPVPQYIYRS